MLKQFYGNWAISTACTAEEALELLRVAHATSTPFQLLIIDENFGVQQQSGSWAIQEIRATEKISAPLLRLSIISWTSNVDTLSKMLLECGADLVWGKPFPEVSVLQDDLRSVLGTVDCPKPLPM